MKALLLEGGGAKGAYQAGAIKALCKKKIYFDAVGGTSIGAINAAFYVCNNLKGMYKLWLSTESNYLFGIDSALLDDISSFKLNREDFKNGFISIGKIIKNRGIDTTNIKKLLSKHIKENRFMRSKIEYGLNTFNLSDRKNVHMFKKDIPKGKLIECILSSAYLPFFRLERIIDDKYYVDGGVRENCPIDMFSDAGYNDIYVIRNWRRPLRYKHKKDLTVHMITPRENLGSIVRFTKDASVYRMNLGYYDMLKYLDNLDGNKYYFKYYDNEYYCNLFNGIKLEEIQKIYKKGNKETNKEFIIRIIEKLCDENHIERFKIHNMPMLITKLKYKMANKKKDHYYDFINNIKVDFN